MCRSARRKKKKKGKGENQKEPCQFFSVQVCRKKKTTQMERIKTLKFFCVGLQEEERRRKKKKARERIRKNPISFSVQVGLQEKKKHTQAKGQNQNSESVSLCDLPKEKNIHKPRDSIRTLNQFLRVVKKTTIFGVVCKKKNPTQAKGQNQNSESVSLCDLQKEKKHTQAKGENQKEPCQFFCVGLQERKKHTQAKGENQR